MKLIIVACLIAVAAASSTPKYNSFGFYPDSVWNPLPSTYEEMSAADKLTALWSEITRTEYETNNLALPQWAGQGFGALLKNIKAFFNLKPTFTHFSDVIAEGRVKPIHTYGTVAPVTFTPAKDTQYSGLFAEKFRGLVRMSYAADPKKAIIPGFAWKFLIDGAPSVNVVSNYALDGQKQNTNFFLNDFRTWLPKPKAFTLKVLGYWFGLTEKDPNNLPVSELAAKRVDGSDVSNPNSPTILVFKPVSDLQNMMSSDSTNDFRDNLANLKLTYPAAFVNVYACSTFEETNNPTELIGSITIDKAPIASFFGDARLFFRHQSKFDRT